MTIKVLQNLYSNDHIWTMFEKKCTPTEQTYMIWGKKTSLQNTGNFFLFWRAEEPNTRIIVLAAQKLAAS